MLKVRLFLYIVMVMYERDARTSVGSRGVSSRSARVAANENPELYQYYYHADHLGSSSYITDLNGEVAQHIEYVPFGEVFIEERNNTWNTPYLFNGKELDEETGLYYYGARYYNPRVSQWLSVDPLWEKSGAEHSPYEYAYSNPIKYIDPNGEENIVVVGAQYEDGAGNKLMFVNQGIRALKKWFKTQSNETRSMVLYKHDYSQKQIEAIRSSVEKYGGKLVLIDSSEEMISYINNRTDDKVTDLEMYSHGIVGEISFGYGYEGDIKKRYSFNSSNVSSLNKNAFESAATIRSYACRTAMDNSKTNNSIVFGADSKNSFAQEIANSTGVTVWGYAKRTDYSNTLGTIFQRRILGAENTLVDDAAFTPDGAHSPVLGGTTPFGVNGWMLKLEPQTNKNDNE